MGMFATKLTLKGHAPVDAAPVSTPAPASRPTDLPIQQFWFVWSPTELCPKRRHPTVTLAVIEAERLGRLAPDKEFLIYEARLVEPNKEIE
jgi:hypothetical protein